MYQLRISPKASKFFKKIKDKNLKTVFKNALEQILADPYVGELKKGDLAGIYCYDIYHNKTNYEIAYTIIIEDEVHIVIILAGTRENFYNEL
ncbi:MAG: type II toxin-antitoxin system RelE/ParE family toxin, partial [Sporomusaceae bacterium]|nr:type II toxin-antitoxin system RelE/ParE family toxin [Sporomusaceae bacterium]